FERHDIVPAMRVQTYRDAFSNVSRIFAAPAGRVSMRGNGLVRDPGHYETYDLQSNVIPVQELPHETLQYLKASRYCEVDLLGELAWKEFGSLAGGAHARVQAICDFAHRRLQFDYQRANPTRTASQALTEGTGVCRDFAHVATTLARCLNIPARYA